MLSSELLYRHGATKPELLKLLIKMETRKQKTLKNFEKPLSVNLLIMLLILFIWKKMTKNKDAEPQHLY